MLGIGGVFPQKPIFIVVAVPRGLSDSLENSVGVPLVGTQGRHKTFPYIFILIAVP